MATDHDFSFPTFSDAIDSPPLWTSSPAKTQQHEKHNDEDDEMESYTTRRKSFSCIETKKALQDENMDLLWENFNEELRQTSSDSDEDYKRIDVGCVQLLRSPALTLSKNGNRTIVSTRRSPNLEIGFPMFNKVFKKLLLVHSGSHGWSSGFNQKNHCTVVGKCRRPKSLSW